MPENPAAAPERALIVFLSASFAWIVSMISAPFDSHGPEARALKHVYKTLAAFSDAIGKENISVVRNSTVNILKESEDTLLTAYIPWKDSPRYNRLSLLNEQANCIFIELLAISYDKNVKFPKEFSDLLRRFSKEINSKESKVTETVPVSLEMLYKTSFKIPKVEEERYHTLLKIMDEVQETMHASSQDIECETKFIKPSIKMKLFEAFDKDSIVFHNAVRYGVILIIAALISLSFPFDKPYWIPLSCASVMMGSTIIGTFNRAVQRSVGTLIGIGFAALVLNSYPGGYVVVLLTMLLTAITEFMIVRNYAIAAIFITANAILIADNATKFSNVTFFMNTRIINVVIGSAIGLIGIYIMGRRSASSRLKDMMVKLMQSQSKVIVWLASNQGKENYDRARWVKEKMRINLANFKMIYTTALGEISNSKEMIENMWPAVFILEYISYLLERICITKGYLNITEEDVAKLLLAYEVMERAIEQEQPIQAIKVPILEEIPMICQEINIMQEILSRNIYY